MQKEKTSLEEYARNYRFSILDGSGPTNEQIIVGALQRIGTALEEQNKILQKDLQARYDANTLRSENRQFRKELNKLHKAVTILNTESKMNQQKESIRVNIT